MSTLPDDPTTPPSSPPHLVQVICGPYEVTLILGPQNEFLGIQQIAISQDFRSQQQKLASLRFHDVSDIYDEDEP